MNTPNLAQLKAIYQPHGNPIDINKIDRFGFVENYTSGLLGFAKSCLHWSTRYDQVNLMTRYVQCYRVNDCNFPGFDRNELLKEIIAPKKINQNIAPKKPGISTREIAKMLVAFPSPEDDNALLKFSGIYGKLRNRLGGETSVNMSIAKKHIKKLGEGAKPSIDQIVKETQEGNSLSNKLSANIKGNYAFEVGLVTIDTLLTFAPCFGNFPFQFLVEGAISTPGVIGLSIGLATMCALSGPIGQGAGNMCDKGINRDGLKAFFDGFSASWRDMIDNENTFHPVLESMINGFLIAITWAYAAVHAKAFKELTGVNFGHKVLYPILNTIFSIGASLHKGTLLSIGAVKSLLYAIFTGLFRGIVKDSLKLVPADFAGKAAAELAIKNRIAAGMCDGHLSVLSAALEVVLKDAMEKLTLKGIGMKAKAA